jgi:opacity protein-like surface antigen
MLIRNLARSACAWIMLVGAASLHGQQWEFGAGAGGSFYPNKTLDSSVGSAKVGFKPNVAGGLWLGNTMGERFGGELRYTYSRGDAKVSSGGTDVAFGAQSHAIYYEFLIYTAPTSSRVRPFLAVGGGIKGYQGTGTERADQPLQQYAALTKTTEWKGLVTFGGGVKWNITDSVLLRAEVRDFTTQFPKEVILPVSSGAPGWIHNIVPMVGISYLFE